MDAEEQLTDDLAGAIVAAMGRGVDADEIAVGMFYMATEIAALRIESVEDD